MIKTIALTFIATLAMTSLAQAAIVTLSGSRTGPIVVHSGERAPILGGLVRLGTLSGFPPGEGIFDIDTVFQEFATGNTSARGHLGQTLSNSAATPFDGEQIYIWIFDRPDLASSHTHSLFTVANPEAPSEGNPWFFPTHTGTGEDVVTLSLQALVDDPDGIFPVFGDRIFIPEPSATLLTGLTGVLIALRRRR